MKLKRVSLNPKGKKLKFECAPRLSTESPELRPFMEKVLKALGHPDAFVTDESTVWEFVFSYEGKAKSAKLRRISKALGFKIKGGEYLIDLAERLRTISMAM